MSNTKTIVFIHGLFMNPKSWDAWTKYFEAEGYTCYAPAFPFHRGEPAELRKNHDARLGKLTFGKVIESLSTLIDALPEKPILIGHSIGGLAVQKLINLDKGIAGIAIDAAPPKGVFSFAWSFIKANLPVINPFRGNSVVLPSLRWWQFSFCNTMTIEAAGKVYETFVVPESRNIPRSTLGKDGYIDFKKPHRPLLFIAGSKDNIIPPSLNEKNYKAYKDAGSIREFKEFEGRTHYICGQENWEEIASFINNWIHEKDI